MNSSEFGMMCMKYVQKHFWREHLLALQFSCVGLSHDLCARAPVHGLEGTLVMSYVTTHRQSCLLSLLEILEQWRTIHSHSVVGNDSWNFLGDAISFRDGLRTQGKTSICSFMFYVAPHQRSTWVIGVNPGGWGSQPPPRFWNGVVGSSWNIILSYNVQEYEMKTLSKVVIQKEKDLCILNKNSGDDTLNPVLSASVCWTFRTHDPSVFKAEPMTLEFSNQIDTADMGTTKQPLL